MFRFFDRQLTCKMHRLQLNFFFVLFFVMKGFFLSAQEPALLHPDVIRITAFNDTVLRNMVNTKQIYDLGLDKLPQIIFWRKIMNLSPDSGIVSLAANRTIYCTKLTTSWDLLGKQGQDQFRDSLRKLYVLGDSASVLFTKGKNDFYDAKSVVPQIDRAIPIFIHQGVDPFYAQAILLIESPGKVLKSNAGAFGPFQLMKSVAIQMGLKVNKHIDERKDFEKSSWAAAKLLRTICIPYTRSMLANLGISYDENELWFRLLVLHVYHAGAGNVAKALAATDLCEGGMFLIQKLWQTKAGAFGKSSQSYSQLAIAAFLELDFELGRNLSRIN